MIATLEDLRAAKAVAEQVRQELGVPPVEIGIMVEVPSTVALAAEFARECDFFSIGTNDLTQYVLAMDRMHPALARQVDGLHPAVLRLVDQAVRAATAEGKWVGVCGGVAGDPRGALILAGLGVEELSMSVPSLAAVKACLRGLVSHASATLARQALAARRAARSAGCRWSAQPRPHPASLPAPSTRRLTARSRLPNFTAGAGQPGRARASDARRQGHQRGLGPGGRWLRGRGRRRLLGAAMPTRS